MAISVSYTHLDVYKRQRYIRIQASPEEFGEVVRLLRERGFTGANVTVPHKQAACSLCNDTDALSRVTGSVNTLVFQKDGSCLLYTSRCV